MVKNLPAVQQTWVQSLGWEDPLEKGNSNPLQCSQMENPMDRGAWQATVHGVTKIWTHVTNTHTDNKWRECYKRWSCSLVALQSRPDRGVQKPGPLLGKRRLLACDSSHVSLGSFRVFSLPFSICTSICLSWCRSLLWLYHTWSFLISWMCSFFSKFVVFSHNFFKYFFCSFYSLLGLLLHLKWCTHWCPTFL